MDEATRLALLNRWQHGFPLCPAPFQAIGQALGLPEAQVIEGYRQLQQQGAISRIGGVFTAGSGGAAVLAAMAVPPDRLEAVAAKVSAHPGVNHNYEREHRFNLWFVMTGPDRGAVEQAMRELEACTGLPALRLRMRRAYRIDLGFDLRHAVSTDVRPQPVAPVPLAADEWPLAALAEEGLCGEPRPFEAWGQALGQPEEQVIRTLEAWLARGTLRRFGVVVRHHELGFDANAMTVFDVPDDRVDQCGAALAGLPGITLAYRRERAAGWPLNLYCMVHGRDRGVVRRVIEEAIDTAGLQRHPHAVLFSRRRFKQIGARRFRPHPVPGALVPAAAVA